MQIRPYRRGEEDALHAVFYSSVHEIAARQYTPSQIEAWAPCAVDAVLWQKRIQSISPYVVEVGGQIAAYGDLQAHGYIDHFFVAGRFGRQGVGTALMQFLLAQASRQGIAEITSDVSLAAQAFFESFGFRYVEHKVVTIRGVELANALMARSSGGQSSGS